MTIKYLANYFKAFLLIFLFIIVLEVCARIDDSIKWGAPLFGTYSRSSLTIVDSHGLRNRPNAHFQKWKINEHGFRGPEIDLDKQEDRIRIMVLGASETFGLYEEEGMEYPAQMQILLNSVAPDKYEVINASVPGLSPPRIFHLYDSWLNKFSPDIVIYYPSPSVYLMRKAPSAVFSERIQHTVKKPFEIRVLSKVRIVLKRIIPFELQVYMKELLIRREVAKRPTDWVYQQMPSERLAIFEAQLIDLVQLIHQGGAGVVLGTHASSINSPPATKYERQLLIGWRKLYPHVAENTFLEMERTGNEIIKKVAKETRSYLVDIDFELTKNKKYFADHVHFTTDGANAVAKLFVEYILENQDKILPSI